MTDLRELPAFPTRRRRPLDPPPEYADLRAERPLARHRWPNGVEGWLVTRYADVRALLGDPRLSVDKTASPPPSLSTGRRPAVMLPKSLIGMDPPEHTPRRRLVIRELTVRRVARLRPRIQSIVDGYLDAMAGRVPPVDLVEAFALPIPSVVISELLGVPAADRAGFERDTAVILRVASRPEDVQRASADLTAYLTALVADKRRRPGEDILSRMAEAEVDGVRLPEDELVNTALLVLIAGHETTANMIGLGVVTLLEHVPRPAEVLADPVRAARAVEELLRYHAVIQFGLVRRATADIPYGDVLIRAGDWVVCSLASANRDETCWAAADRLDLDREQGGHVSFGYGIHQCAGQHLARAELEIALTSLFRRFPGLRLAVPLDELPFRGDMFVYGLHELPVAW
jgi:cytochrome P450